MKKWMKIALWAIVYGLYLAVCYLCGFKLGGVLGNILAEE